MISNPKTGAVQDLAWESMPGKSEAKGDEVAREIQEFGNNLPDLPS